MRKVVVSGPPPVQILDVTGPLQVFSNVPGYQVTVVASRGSDPLQTDRGITLPGGRAASRSRRVASICTGAVLLAAAGLLDGKRAVTNSNCSERLAKEFPQRVIGITAGECVERFKRVTADS